MRYLGILMLLWSAGCQMQGPKGPSEFPDDVERQADDLRSEYEIDDEYLIDMEKKP
jgi:hypothetical protein